MRSLSLQSYLCHSEALGKSLLAQSLRSHVLFLYSKGSNSLSVRGLLDLRANLHFRVYFLKPKSDQVTPLRAFSCFLSYLEWIQTSLQSVQSMAWSSLCYISNLNFYHPVHWPLAGFLQMRCWSKDMSSSSLFRSERMRKKGQKAIKGRKPI